MSRLPWCVGVLVSCGCVMATPPAAPACAGDGALEPEQKRRAEALTSVFENDTVVPQYAYAEALDDGRGITAGRAGFTTATGDLLEVVEVYVAQTPDSPLASYLPRLQELAAAGSDELAGLEGLPQAWADAAEDPMFRAAQDAVVDELYYEPALAHAQDLGLCLPLSVAIVYDTIIQHGEGDDPDGLDALVDETIARQGGTVADGVEEGQWIRSFLTVRREDLAHASDPDTRQAWAESVDRCDVLRDLVDEGNWYLDGPIDIDSAEHTATIE